MFNPVTQAYLDGCRDGRLRDVVRRAPLSPGFREVYGEQLADRPFFAAKSLIDNFATDLEAFIELLITLPRRLFDGDLAAYCDALGIDERNARLLCRDATDRPPRYARPDLYFDGTGFKLLEFNICSALGGLDHAVINSALMEVDEFRSFADEHRLGYVDTAQEFSRALHKVADPVTAGDAPVVAMVEWKDGLKAYGRRMDVFREVMGAAGLDVRPTEVGLLTERGGKLRLPDGTPVDMVLRYFTIDELIADPHGEEAIEPILRANDAGGTVLFTTLQTYLYSNKGNLALLSDPRSRSAFTAAERALIDRVLPWTRTLLPGRTDADGESVDLIDYVLANREDLILKPRVGFAGIGTVPGWQTGAADWRESVTSLAERGYIVQRRVVPEAEPIVPADGGEPADWIAAWTFFFTDEGYAGSSFVRTIPAGKGPIISPSTKPRMCTTSLFTYPA